MPIPKSDVLITVIISYHYYGIFFRQKISNFLWCWFGAICRKNPLFIIVEVGEAKILKDIIEQDSVMGKMMNVFLRGCVLKAFIASH